ncbi:hypothetical protein L596_016240 [Steinernema carpocapsae]|uniref:Nucleotide-diphospho-sugar transferase domain-containing protein n=3 Tax=Steinernema carpocapsae TaxID=34508 RepID=A0A4U5NHI2_STECR|nr:hypothetical protein L596_016240 [Steinernema carpocapsae]
MSIWYSSARRLWLQNAMTTNRIGNTRHLLFLIAVLCSLLLLISFYKTEFHNHGMADREHFMRHIRPDSNFEKFAKNDLSDEHVHVMPAAPSLLKKRTIYPKRENMGECKPLFGKVVVFVAYVESSMKTHYKVAQDSLHCYLKGVNYTTAFVDLDHDKRVKENCPHDQLFFKKHCAASVYLQDADWMLVLDADTAVVNPNHCIEEWIDDRVDLVFYERFFNWEIASGNYLVKNTEFARTFLRKWADWQYIQPSNWNGADNGVLQIHILQTVLPDAVEEIKACDAIWHKGTDYDTYMAYVTCVKVTLGANRLYPGKIRIHRRAHGWVRDGFLTGDNFCDNDFMLHGWKLQAIELEGWNSPFRKMFNVSECGTGYLGWNYRPGYKITPDEVRKRLAAFEASAGNTFPKNAQVFPYLTQPDVGNCYPKCDDLT